MRQNAVLVGVLAASIVSGCGGAGNSSSPPAAAPIVSGATIAVGMLLGVRREAAARFTFLLAIPAILAAAGKESIELRHMHPDAQLLTLFAVGAAVSALVGYLTIKYFLRYLTRHRLDVFAYYRLALAAVTLARLAL